MWPSRRTCDVLVVCTGNVCRSPYIAARLRQQLPALRITSAGTGALVGRPPTEQVQSLLLERGVDRVASVGRTLSRGDVRGARLIITAEHTHRVAAVRLAPVAAGRTFTLLELTRALRGAGSPVGIDVDGVIEVGRRDLSVDPGLDLDDDLDDPYGRDDEDYRLMSTIVESALEALVPALGRTR